MDEFRGKVGVKKNLREKTRERKIVEKENEVFNKKKEKKKEKRVIDWLPFRGKFFTVKPLFISKFLSLIIFVCFIACLGYSHWDCISLLWILCLF